MVGFAYKIVQDKRKECAEYFKCGKSDALLTFIG